LWAVIFGPSFDKLTDIWTYPDEIGKTLGSARHKLAVDFRVSNWESVGLPQTQLAAKLGEYPSFVARLESGQRRIDVIEFLDLAAKLGFDPAKAIRQVGQ
jgi:hypothetical protein